MDPNDYFVYEPKTGKLFWKAYIPRVGGQEAGCLSQGYIRVGWGGTNVMAHSIIWRMVKGYWPKEIDHINRDRADNRWENLREVTHSVNMVNRPLQSNNTSGHKGVTWNSRKKKWWACIKRDGHTTSLGYYENIEDAVFARKRAEHEEVT